MLECPNINCRSTDIKVTIDNGLSPSECCCSECGYEGFDGEFIKAAEISADWAAYSEDFNI